MILCELNSQDTLKQCVEMSFDSTVGVGWAGYGCVGGLSYLSLSLERERQLTIEVPDSRNSLLILFSFKGTSLVVANRRHEDKNREIQIWY